MTSGLLRRASRGLWQTGRKLVAGQPTQQTHPEVTLLDGRAQPTSMHQEAAGTTPKPACICMLKGGTRICVQVFADGEVVPGILLEEVQRRRQHLASSMPPDSLAVLPGAHMQYMSGVIPYRFRQEADFEYLTGIRQPDAVAVLECATRGRPCQQPTGCSSVAALHYHPSGPGWRPFQFSAALPLHARLLGCACCRWQAHCVPQGPQQKGELLVILKEPAHWLDAPVACRMRFGTAPP